MENVLATYLNRRLYDEKIPARKKMKSGPVITISREVGCNGLKIANKLASRLNNRRLQNNWRVLSKEVFSESARELDLHPEKVRQIFKKTDKYTFDEILNAFNIKRFKSERVIVKTVIGAIRSFSENGFCIIVGRAGHIIAKDINNALHIRLYAPLDYRIRNIMENNRLSKEEATVFIEKVEKERIAFRKAIREESLRDEYFDLYINRASFEPDATIDLIEQAMEKKQVLKGFPFQMDYF